MKARRLWYMTGLTDRLALVISTESHGTHGINLSLGTFQVDAVRRFEQAIANGRAGCESPADPPTGSLAMLSRVARRADELAAEARNRARDAAQDQAGVGGVNGPDYRMVHHWNGRAEAFAEIGVFAAGLLQECEP